MMELCGSLFVSLIGAIPSLPVRAQGYERLSRGGGMLLPAPRASLLPGGSVHPYLGIPGHARLVPCSGHSPVS